MNEKIKHMIDLLTEEQFRVKTFLNSNGFDCTSAPYVIGKQYRDSIKKQIALLRDNLDENA